MHTSSFSHRTPTEHFLPAHAESHSSDPLSRQSTRPSHNLKSNNTQSHSHVYEYYVLIHSLT